MRRHVVVSPPFRVPLRKLGRGDDNRDQMNSSACRTTLRERRITLSSVAPEGSKPDNRSTFRNLAGQTNLFMAVERAREGSEVAGMCKRYIRNGPRLWPLRLLAIAG